MRQPGFSSPRSKKNILLNKSVKNLISFHITAFDTGGGVSPRMGAVKRLRGAKKQAKELFSHDKRREGLKGKVQLHMKQTLT